ncbi:TIGR01440 family protein [Sporomusa sphaeroides]|uniref:TIGR01440 family protein n=1 Tax=Sporomusa sphaeroides TaxID=47679 RepID=UPI0031594556
METDLATIGRQITQAAEELIKTARLKPGNILVVGCSTSEVQGARIGSYGSEVVAARLLSSLFKVCSRYQVSLAIQCCEHLNRALVVEQAVADKYNLEVVQVIPVPKAGGALAAEAMRAFANPAVVESITAQAGLDIGSTLIGMHIKKVAIPVRLTQKYIGQAYLTAARTRPKLIGGARAVYELC